MKHRYLVPLACLSLLVGCGAVNVTVKPQTTFTKGATITVEADSADRLGVHEKLGRLLSERGFEMVSGAVTREKVQLQSEADAGAAAKSTTTHGDAAAAFVGESRSQQSPDKGTEVKPSYILRFRYHAYHDVFYWSFTSLNATIANSTTGEVVASVDFSGDRSVDGVLEDFANKLALSAR